MTIRIESLSETHLADAQALDGSFTVHAHLRLLASATGIVYEVMPVAPYLKQYGDTDGEGRALPGYLHAADRGAFLAYANGRPAGLLLLSEGWNRLAVIDDIEVDVTCRRQGVGRALIEQTEVWARARGLAGIRLETQDNNVAACKLYERCGFVLGGFDRFLYAGLDKSASETALFWYRLWGHAGR